VSGESSRFSHSIQNPLSLGFCGVTFTPEPPFKIISDLSSVLPTSDRATYRICNEYREIVLDRLGLSHCRRRWRVLLREEGDQCRPSGEILAETAETARTRHASIRQRKCADEPLLRSKLGSRPDETRTANGTRERTREIEVRGDGGVSKSKRGSIQLVSDSVGAKWGVYLLRRRR